MSSKPLTEPIGSINTLSENTAQFNSDIAALEAQPLFLKYRPQRFSEVVGHAPIISSLEQQISSPSRPHVFLFTGPSGVGKTSLARLISKELGCGEILEIDAASNSGVDIIRDHVAAWQFPPMGLYGRMVILDECHTLSTNAWQPLLKLLEEPPAHFFCCLCTTLFSKVPETIVTRCQHYSLPSLTRAELEDFIETIPELVPIDPIIKGALVGYGEGSVRRLLAGAEKVYRLTDTKQAVALLREEMEGNDPGIQLARMLATHRFSWARARSILNDVSNDQVEGIRRCIVSYMGKAILGQENQGNALRLAETLEPLLQPIASTAELAAILLLVNTK